MIAVPPQAPQQATPAAPLVPEINPAALDALVGGLSQFLPVAAAAAAAAAQPPQLPPPAEPTPELLAALEAAEEIEFPPATQKVLGQILDALVKEENTEKIPVVRVHA